MNPNHAERTKAERWEVRRLAKRVRGLYTAEQQALNFVAEAQTQSRGVCSQSIRKHAADYGYLNRNIQWGLHGKKLKGKPVYPGLLVRGIVYLAGGYPSGGRAAGGAGLTPDYAINVDVMMQFIPGGNDDEITAPPKKDETLDETKDETSLKKDETYDVLMRTSSLSSSLVPDVEFSNEPTAGEDARRPQTATAASQQLLPVYTDVPIYGDTLTRCSSMKKPSQTGPPSGVTCPQVAPTASASDEKAGLRLQAALSRISKTKLHNRRRIPKNLTEKFELLAMIGVTVVSRDFGKWCDEDPAAKRKMPYPVHEYVKVADSRLSGVPAEDPRIAEQVDELRAFSYELTNILPTKKQQTQITNLVKAYPMEALKRALTYFIDNLPEDPTSSIMNSFWTTSSIDAVLRAEHKMREATDECDEYLRTAKPVQHDLQALKRKVGILPFTRRLSLSSTGHAACPFHEGDGEKSFHVERQEDGVGIGTCFSICNKKFDAIAFVEKFDKLSTRESIRKLLGLFGDIDNGSASAGLPPKPPPLPMTPEKWTQSGRAVSDADAATLAASRPNSKTSSAATLNTMGFKIGEKYGQVFLIAPYRLGNTFYTLKARSLATKEFIQENAISQKGLFSIDAVQADRDVYIVESELDAAVLHEHGLIAVSVMNAGHRQLEPEVLEKLLTSSRIFLVGDQDAAGQLCMDNLAGLLPAEKVCRLLLPDGVKDVGEWAMSAQFQEQFETARNSF